MARRKNADAQKAAPVEVAPVEPVEPAAKAGRKRRADPPAIPFEPAGKNAR